MTPKGQGRDPKILEAPYCRNHTRYTYGYNWPPIENTYCKSNGPGTGDVM